MGNQNNAKTKKEEVTIVELLAPARNAEVAKVAIDHGADAVYMGASSHGARQQAANSIDEIREVVDYAHRFNVKVYVTVNTIVYDDELEGVRSLVWQLYAAGVDALIVQDMSLLKMDLPPIALHASTQCDIRTPEKAQFMQDVGFAQLVLPRELSFDEIRRYREAVTVPLEAFVHGALCVSYSGDCQASYLTTGRSANRGECAQICRYKFDLEDADGRKIVQGKHLLSLKDMNRLAQLSDMLEAGVSSFKIEGRLKDANYVKNVVSAYSQALNSIVAANPDKYRRGSRGLCQYSFTPNLEKSFNRGYTSYFLTQTTPSVHALASIDSPKWVGEKVGKVVRPISPRLVAATLNQPLENGDGLGYFDENGEFCGFRLNRADGNRLFSASDIAPARGTVLYRNSDKRWNEMLERKTSRRVIGVDMRLCAVDNVLSLEVSDADGVAVVASKLFEPQQAKSPQTDARANTLGKLGDTEFALMNLADELGNLFVPASVLTALRREAIDLMRETYKATYRYDRRRKAVDDLRLPEGYEVTRHDNISNHISAKFYMDLQPSGGVKAKAVEVSVQPKDEIRVMQSRYCIRRELGACLKTEGKGKLPSPIYLVSGNLRFRVDCDCRNCRMNVILLPKQN